MATVMSSFEDKLTKKSEESFKKHVTAYKEELDKLEEANKKSLDEAITDYNSKREKLDNKLNSNVNKLVSNVEKNINSKISAAKDQMDARLAQIDDELFNDPNKLYQKILNARNDLKKQRDDFKKERKLWDKDDKRCASWLGISYDVDDEINDSKYNGLDDEEPANDAESKPKLKISDNDFIVIKIDDRTFRTYRGTLTQIKGSFIAKLFGAHSDMIHRDTDGAYCLNCDANIFAEVLEILRKRGTMTHDFKMTHKLYAALMEYGILDAFFPAYHISDLGVVKTEKNAKDYHVVFQSWRSTANKDNYILWNMEHLTNTKSVNNEDGKDDGKDDEKKDVEDNTKADTETYWKLNPNDDSELIIEKPGYYRIVFRCSIYHSSHIYVRILVNGSSKEYCYHYNQSTNRYKSYNFNEVREYKKNDKIKFQCSASAYIEAKGSYFCIERIPDAVSNSIGIWTSSSTDSNYRQWNSTLKSSVRYNLTNSNKNVTIQRGGLYRVTGRIHTYYGSAGGALVQLYEYRNGGNRTLCNYQSKSNSSSYYQCHTFDEIASFKKEDYVMFYDNGHKTAGTASCDGISLQLIPFSHLVGHWRSSSVKDTYLRKWNYEQWNNDVLYKLDNDQVKIEVKERGFYRISAHLTNYQGNEEGYSSLYLNDQEYAKSRMGSYNGSYYHTASLQEIIFLKEGDKLHLYSSKPYTAKDYNSFWIEKLL